MPVLLTILSLATFGGGGYYVTRHTSWLRSSDLAALGLSAADEARLTAVLEPSGERLLAHPRSQSILRSRNSAGAQRAMLELTALGFRRLSDAELIRWNSLRMRLAEGSPAVCAGMWSGNVSDRELIRGLLRLSDDDLRAWFALTERAILSELDATSPAPDYQHVLIRGLRRIGSRLPAGRRQAFFASFGRQLRPEQACDTVLVLLRGVDQLEPDIRVRFLRSLAGALHDASAAGRGQRPE